MTTRERYVTIRMRNKNTGSMEASYSVREGVNRIYDMDGEMGTC